MDINNAKRIVKSKLLYNLFDEQIIILRNNIILKTIHLPRNDKVVAFDDMYYADDGLRIIIATRDAYDLVGILNENELTLDIKGITK